MAKCATREFVEFIQRKNSATLNAERKPFKIVDGLSCGNCKSFTDDRCKVKRKAVNHYNICERHEQKQTVS